MKNLIKNLSEVFYSSLVRRHEGVLDHETHRSLMRDGKRAGVSGTPIETIYQAWKTTCENSLNEKTTDINNDVKKLQSDNKREEVNLKKSDEQLKKEFKTRNIKNSRKQEAALENLKKKKESELDKAGDTVEDTSEDLDDFREKFGLIPTHKNFFDTAYAFPIFIGGLIVFEALINHDGFIGMEMQDIMVYPLSVFLSIAIGISAEFIGKNYVNWRIFTMLGWLFFGLTILTALTISRLGTDHNILFSITGYVIFGIAIFISCYRSVRKEAWILIDKHESAKKDVEIKNEELNELESEQADFKKNFETDIDLSVKTSREISENIIDSNNKTIERLELELESITAHNKQVLKEGKETIEKGYAKGRRTGRNIRRNNAAVLLLLFTMSIMTSCSNQVTSTEVILASDKTKLEAVEYQHSADDIYDGIEQTFLFDDNIYNGHTMRIVTITNSSVPSINTFEIPAITNRLDMVTKKRMREIKAYKSRIKIAIKDVVESPLQSGKTSLNRNICYLSEILEGSIADKKMLMIISNALDTTTGQFEDVEYFERNTKEEVAEIFSKDCQLSDISDVDVRLVYNNVNIDERLISNARKFWKHYFLSNKAKSFQSMANPKTQF